jgi:AraC-like DNA-binding protein
MTAFPVYRGRRTRHDHRSLAGTLSLDTLSERVGVPARQISRIINPRFGCNFNEWVNAHRVEEVKRQLADKRIQHLSVAAIGEAAGFRSKSVFNAAFRKLAPRRRRRSTGVTTAFRGGRGAREGVEASRGRRDRGVGASGVSTASLSFDEGDERIGRPAAPARPVPSLTVGVTGFLLVESELLRNFDEMLGRGARGVTQNSERQRRSRPNVVTPTVKEAPGWEGGAIQLTRATHRPGPSLSVGVTGSSSSK